MSNIVNKWLKYRNVKLFKYVSKLQTLSILPEEKDETINLKFSTCVLLT